MASLEDTEGDCENARKPSVSSDDNEASRQQPEDDLDFLEGEDYSRYYKQSTTLQKKAYSWPIGIEVMTNGEYHTIRPLNTPHGPVLCMSPGAKSSLQFDY